MTGAKQHPVFTFLVNGGAEIHWNFGTKFLAARDGQEVRRFDRILPEELEGDVVELLGAGEASALAGGSGSVADAASAQ